MFLKRSAGFIVYFIIISIVSMYFEITIDGFNMVDFTGIFLYSGIATLIITAVLLVIELCISLFKDHEIRFWTKFNFNNSLLVFPILLILIIILYLTSIKIEIRTMILWVVVLIVGEVLRMIYNRKIIKNKYVNLKNN